jgi:hypothetical protein
MRRLDLLFGVKHDEEQNEQQKTKVNQLTNELIILKVLNKKKTKIVSFGDNQGVAFVNEIKRVNALQN